MITTASTLTNRIFNSTIIAVGLLVSIVLIEDNIEFPSLLFFLTALTFSLYLIWKRIKSKRKKNHDYNFIRRKEITFSLLALSTSSVIGFFETFPKHETSTILLALILCVSLFIICNEYYSNNRMFEWIKSKKRNTVFAFACVSLFSFLITALIIESEEVLNLIILVFSLAFIMFCLKWIFIQTKDIINLKNEKKKTELMHLQNQVNPHFFFNVLNNLYGTVGKNPKKAQEIILKLSDMMRYSIYNGQKERATIEEEIQHLENFITLNKMRYHKNIDVDFDINIADKSIEVIPLLYLMLLENAFKHGAEKLREGAFVKIKIENVKNEVKFTVTNNYDTTSISQESGIGLKNLKRRLELAYPEKHTLTISYSDGLYEAQLNLSIL